MIPNHCVQSPFLLLPTSPVLNIQVGQLEAEGYQGKIHSFMAYTHAIMDTNTCELPNFQLKTRPRSLHAQDCERQPCPTQPKKDLNTQTNTTLRNMCKVLAFLPTFDMNWKLKVLFAIASQR